MGKFFKTILKGLLYILVLPLLLIFLAIYLVISLIGMFVVLIKGAISFFGGHNIFKELPEDIEAQRRLDIQNGLNKEAEEQPLVQPQQGPTIINVYQGITPADVARAGLPQPQEDKVSYEEIPDKYADSPAIEAEYEEIEHKESPINQLPHVDIPQIERIVTPISREDSSSQIIIEEHAKPESIDLEDYKDD